LSMRPTEWKLAGKAAGRGGQGLRSARIAPVIALAAALVLPAAAGAAGPFKAKTCVDCHADVKQETGRKHAHAPFKDRDCEACHLPHGVVGALVLKADDKELCLTCHQDLEPVLRQAVVHRPAARGKCDACHDPHGSGFPALLPAESGEACFACHDAGPFRRNNVHRPLTK